METKILEDRLIDFSVLIISVCDGLKNSYASNNYGNQLIRSSGASALNYGEARSAESPKDFVHKMGICLKELRESFSYLRIIAKANLYKEHQKNIEIALDENNQLSSIFVASIRTSKNNNSKIKNR